MMAEINEEARWYVLHTISGYENVAKDNLRRVAEKNNLQDRIFDIVIPTEDVLEEKNGKKVLVNRKVMPTYLLVKMIYGDDIWHTVTRTRGITGFVGQKGRPLPLNENEIMAMRLEKVKVDISIAPNDHVEILDGPFNGVVGLVLAVDAVNQKAKINVEMFGRDTPIDVALDQIRKVTL
jgi:transcriptional antiterminator NusG